jgi:hypothetical protein
MADRKILNYRLDLYPVTVSYSADIIGIEICLNLQLRDILRLS